MNSLFTKQIWAGKLIGAFVGLLTGGPFGLFIGLLAGNAFDRMYAQKIAPPEAGRDESQSIFFRVTFLTMGQLAKSDGRVSEQEIDQARFIMNQMGLNERQRKEAIKLFTEGKEQAYDLTPDLERFNRAVGSRGSLVQLFLEIQLTLAYADGELSISEKRLLDKICRTLGVSALQFQYIHTRVRAAQAQYRQRNQHNGVNELQNAYGVLGVSSGATDAEVKKAYRKLMSEHHPDKLVSKGLPEEMMQIAKEKAQEIQTAYDVVRKARKAA